MISHDSRYFSLETLCISKRRATVILLKNFYFNLRFFFNILVFSRTKRHIFEMKNK